MADYRQLHDQLGQVFDKQMFFVTGLTRSGTVWVQKAIDAHPEAACRGEGHFIDMLYPQLKRAIGDYNQQVGVGRGQMEAAGVNSVPSDFTYQELEYLLATSIGLAFNRWIGDDHVKCVGERTPDYAINMEMLSRVMPNAKFINVIRDGRDEVASAWTFNRRYQGEQFSKRFPEFSDFVDVFANSWAGAVGDARRFGRAHRDIYIDVCYEDLLSDPGPVMRDVCLFLGLYDSDEALDQCIRAGDAGAMPDGSVGSWRDTFDDEAERTFTRYAGELLKLLDYSE
jgi:hypothetical protein